MSVEDNSVLRPAEVDFFQNAQSDILEGQHVYMYTDHLMSTESNYMFVFSGGTRECVKGTEHKKEQKTSTQRTKKTLPLKLQCIPKGETNLGHRKLICWQKFNNE